VNLVSSTVRNYLYSYPLSHLLGYTGLVDYTGKVGVEKQYDEQLRGEPGILYVEVDARQNPQKEVGVKESIQGEALCLAIDAELQEFIFNTLAEREARGAVIVMDPRQGAVRALVNYPSFDANVFSQPAHKEAIKNFLQDDSQPLFNRAISGSYSPGSTIKPLLAAAALEEEVITKRTTMLSTGGITIGQWYFPDWKIGGHGVTDVTKAIAESVNTFFYSITGGDESQRGMGIKKSVEYLEAFSWGKKTGIDLPAEEDGLLPTPEWKQEVKHERWYVGDTYHLGIGQGDVLATPLQVTAATVGIANGGYLYEPRVAIDCSEDKKEVFLTRAKKRRLPISAGHMKTVQVGMRRAVLERSAKRLKSLPIEVAGKTGTAQIGGSEDTHAWFTSWGPYTNPELVITVLLERGGEGDKQAVPVAEEIWSWWGEHRRSNQ
jgi:penicillin-binding protein 2